MGRHLPAGAEPREVADLGREGGGEREPAPLDRLERLDLRREGARRDGGPVLGEEVVARLGGRLDLVPQGGERPNPAIVLRPDLVEPPQEVVGPVLPRVAGGRGAAVDEPPLCEEGEQPLLGGRQARGRPVVGAGEVPDAFDLGGGDPYGVLALL